MIWQWIMLISAWLMGLSAVFGIWPPPAHAATVAFVAGVWAGVMWKSIKLNARAEK